MGDSWLGQVFWSVYIAASFTKFRLLRHDPILRPLHFEVRDGPVTRGNKSFACNWLLSLH